MFWTLRWLKIKTCQPSHKGLFLSLVVLRTAFFKRWGLYVMVTGTNMQCVASLSCKDCFPRARQLEHFFLLYLKKLSGFVTISSISSLSVIFMWWKEMWVLFGLFSAVFFGIDELWSKPSPQQWTQRVPQWYFGRTARDWRYRETVDFVWIHSVLRTAG